MSQTTNKGYDIITVGGAFDQWGGDINSNMTILDTNLGGVGSISVAGNANVTASASQAQNLIQQLTGALTGNIEYILPQLGGFYVIENNSTGAFSILITTGAGNGIYAPQGSSIWVYCDGTNIIAGVPQGWQEIGTYTISGTSAQTILLPAIFRRFRLTLENMLVSSAGDLIYLQFSPDNGSSFKVADYVWNALSISSPAGAFATNGNQVDAGLPVSPALFSPTGSGLYDATIEIFPGSASANATVRANGFGIGSGDVYAGFQIWGSYYGTSALMNAIQIYNQTQSGHTISGTIILEGLP